MTKRAHATLAEISTSEDFFLAQTRWVEFWAKQGDDEPPSFAEFLGLSSLTRLGPGLYGMDKIFDLDPGPDISPKIRMLCGPHWYALLKAYQLRKGNDGG